MEIVEQMNRNEDILTEKIVQGIPYLHITKMIYPRACDTYAQYGETFLARAAQFSQKPVSYTHLDVYKRQSITREKGRIVGFWC